MQVLNTKKLIFGFQTVKTNFIQIWNSISNLSSCPVEVKCAALSPYSVMHFDSTKDQVSDEYLTVAQLAQRYPAFTQGSIRWLIFNANSNGFNRVIRKIGRKVVLNLREFRQFIEEQTR